ncbi:MAG: arginine deiminase family protein [Anaerolineae bacterium]|jgi:N-dimethylarginine dimethylaminohydrolase
MVSSLFSAAAYGGDGWSPRRTALRQEIGSIWGSCGVDSEWASLQSVLLHRPGTELEGVTEPDRAQMMEPLDADRARRQHSALADTFQDAGVTVRYVDPDRTSLPNLMFVADLMFMTPEGAILGRPASTVRAGEERLVARRLSDLGVPILRSVRGHGTFEGADAAWIDQRMVMLATGLRTNAEGAAQVTALLREMGVEVVHVGLPYGAMHLMGQLRFADRDLAVAWPGRVPHAAVEALRDRRFRVLFLPDENEAKYGMALNFVTLGPRRILTAAGNHVTQSFYEEAGIDCVTVELDELTKAAGGIGCLTGVLRRESIG